MTRPQKLCLDCGALHRNPGPRCGPHEREHQRIRNQARTQYQGTWRATSRRARKAQPWCSLCGKPAGAVQLTLDHEHGQVECRSCNSSHRKDAS